MSIHVKQGDTDLEIAKDLVLGYLRDQRVRIWLFGSRAWGNARRSSDIDIAILPMESLRPGTLTELQEYLDESALLHRAEIFDLRKVDPGLRDKVLSQGISWRI